MHRSRICFSKDKAGSSGKKKVPSAPLAETHSKDLARHLEKLKSKDADERMEAVIELERIKDVSTVPAIIETLGDEDSWVRLGAAFALIEMNDRTCVSPIIETFGDVVEDVRVYAALNFNKIGDASDIPALIEALGGENRDVRECAVIALHQTKDPSVVPALIEALGDADQRVRWLAGLALADIPDVSAVPALIEALGDGDGYVRYGAAAALEEIGDYQLLIRAIPDAKGTKREELLDMLHETRSEMIKCIEKVGSAKDIPGLVQLVEDWPNKRPNARPKVLTKQEIIESIQYKNLLLDVIEKIVSRFPDDIIMETMDMGKRLFGEESAAKAIPESGKVVLGYKYIEKEREWLKDFFFQ